MKKTIPIILSAFMLASCSKQDAVKQEIADNEVVVTATRVLIGEGLKRPRIAVSAPRNEKAVIVGEESGGFKTKIQCRDAANLVRILDSEPDSAREAGYIDRVREDHHLRMQAPGSKRNIPPMLKFTFSTVDGPVNEVEGLERGYRALARQRMEDRANDYRNAHALCQKME